MGRLSSVVLGAFILGAAYGLVRSDYPWQGEGAIANLGAGIGSGLGFAVLMCVVWALWQVGVLAVRMICRTDR